MTNLVQWAWAISLILLLLAIIVTRNHLTLPWFSLYLTTTGVQAIVHFHNWDSHNSWWIRWAACTALLKSLSVVEVLLKRSQGMPFSREWITASSATVYGTVYLYARIRQDAPWIEAAMIFRHIECGTLFLLLVGMWITYVWSPWPFTGETDPREVRFICQHSWILSGLLAGRVVGAIVYENLPTQFTDTEWLAIQVWTYPAATICFWAWTQMVLYPRRLSSLI